MKKITICSTVLVISYLVFIIFTQPIIYEVTPDNDFVQADPTSTRVRPFTVDKHEYPFASHWFERNGVAMHYIDEGEGIPIVLTHGNPDWSFVNRKIVKALSDEARVIAFDLPGFGFSDAPEDFGYTPKEYTEWISALVHEHLKLEKFILVLQDWGGPTGLPVALENPDSVIGLVISNTWAWESEGWLKWGSYFMRTPFMQRMIINRNHVTEGVMMHMLSEEAINNKAVVDAYIMATATPERRRGTAVFPTRLTRDTDRLNGMEEKLTLLKDKPTEFIFGTQDKYVGSKEIIDRWKSHYPDAPFTILPNVSHFTQEDSPESFVNSLRRIMMKIDRQSIAGDNP
jgi:haloalkane dehalogenase